MTSEIAKMGLSPEEQQWLEILSPFLSGEEDLRKCRVKESKQVIAFAELLLASLKKKKQQCAAQAETQSTLSGDNYIALVSDFLRKHGDPEKYWATDDDRPEKIRRR
jgi:hypothetical protein